MRMLITGFEPFGDSTRNPSAEILTRLESTPPDAEISTLLLPVVTEQAADLLVDAFDRMRPSIVLMLGEAGGTDRVRIEEVAINRRRFSIPDNLGRLVEDDVVVVDGPVAHFSSLPTLPVLDHLRSLDLPVESSGSAGMFICNEVSYRMLDHLARVDSGTIAGFVHVPRMPEQVAPGQPCLPLHRSLSVVARLTQWLKDHA